MYEISWHDNKTLKVFDTIHNKTYFVSFDNFEDELIEMGCFNQVKAEEEINAFLDNDLFESEF